MKQSGSGIGAWWSGTWRAGALGVFVLPAGLGCLGCASPGVPQPPSLHLPEIAREFTADRVGDTVRLRWTVPPETTDGEAIRHALKGGVTAVICREDAPRSECRAIDRRVGWDGTMEAEERLSGALAEGSARPIGYRVELMNDKGRSAGKTAAVIVAGGAGVGPVTDLQVASGESGLVARWKLSGAGDPVELRRELPGESGVTVLGGGSHDEGGMVDVGAVRQRSYRYTAQRVRQVTLGGRSLVLRGVESAPVTATYVDRFAPAIPRGVAAVPGPGSIDLSWEAGGEADLAGYVVYRSEAGGAEVRLTPKPIARGAFRDETARAGHMYAYRVTAVDAAGNESAPSLPVEERLTAE